VDEDEQSDSDTEKQPQKKRQKKETPIEYFSMRNGLTLHSI